MVYSNNESIKFFKEPITYHLGIYAAGFANGLIVAGFEGNEKAIFGAFSSEDYGQPILEFGARSLGVGTEFGLTSFAKSKYKTINGKGFGGKAGKGSLKNIGYILTTYF